MSPFWNLKFHLAKWQIHVPIIQLKLFLVGLIGRPVAVFNILTVLMQLRKHQELNKTQGQSPEHKDLLRLPISRYQVEVVAILFPLDPQSAIWINYFSVPDLHWVSGKVWMESGGGGGYLPAQPSPLRIHFCGWVASIFWNKWVHWRLRSNIHSTRLTSGVGALRKSIRVSMHVVQSLGTCDHFLETLSVLGCQILLSSRKI